MNCDNKYTLLYNYIVCETLPNQQLYWTLRNQYHLDDFTSTVLSCKNIKQDSDINNFLNPKVRNLLPDPFIMKDMYRGVCATLDAIVNRHKICIFADYDVDGATSSAILVRFLDTLGISVDVYVPDRFKEGYGPNIKALNSLKESGCELIITVDCGIVAFNALKFAHEIGLKVVVIDHHLGEEALPIANAVINPNRIDDESNLGYLCGAGVAFMFATAIARFIKLMQQKQFTELAKYDHSSRFLTYQTICDQFDINRINLIGLIDLVALGTVCDMVPIVGLNRAFVKSGIDAINKNPSLGIKSMLQVKQVQNLVSTYEFGFVLGPMINAGSRIDKAFLGSKLLSTKNQIEATEIANYLSQLNEQRKNIQTEIYEKALEKAKQLENRERVIFLYDENWHQGVIGIIAGKIKDCMYLPTIIGSVEKDENDTKIIKASCRSIAGIDLGSAILKAVSDGILLKGGGHAMAAGFSIELAKVDLFNDFLANHFGEEVVKCSRSKLLNVDYSISLSSVNNDLLEKIKQFEPFGVGNEELLFKIHNFHIVKSNIIKDKHLKLHLSNYERNVFIGAIMFNVDETNIVLSTIKQKNIAIIGNIVENNYNNNITPQIVIKDFILESQ